MNINVGCFKCPKCGYKDMFNFKKWTYIDKVENNTIKKKWIFYKEEEKKFYCCICAGFRGHFKFKNIYRSFICVNDRWESCYTFFHLNPLFRVIGIIFGSILFGIFMLLTILFYIFIFFWFDIIYYLCCYKKEFIIYIPSESKYIFLHYNDPAYNIKDDYNLWKYEVGYTETEYVSWFNPFICENCKYKSNTFIPFLDFDNVDIADKKKSLGKSGIAIDVNQDTNENNIAINILEPLGGNEAISCKKNDLFSDVLVKFYERAKKYKDEQCFFLANGGVIKKDKTIEENGLKDGDKIQLHIKEIN